MDSTTQSTVEIIQRLEDSLSDGDELRSLLKPLLINLQNEDSDELLPQVISQMLRTAVQVLPLHEVDSTLLAELLPLTKNLLSKKLSTNNQLIDEADHFEDDSLIPIVLKNIETCIQVLSDIDCLLAYLASFDRISVSDFSTAPKNIAEVVFLIFSHCQKSKTEYKDVFSTVKSELMSLFQQCYQVQVKLFILLKEKLIFNCVFEDEIHSLVAIIDTLNLTSEVVADLDTMSLVAHWKGFAHLTQTYSTHLCSRLDVARPITYLSAIIAHQLDNLKVYVDSEKKVVLRVLKISSLQLKVLIKLCEQYQHHLGDCHQQLLLCLVALTARSSHSLSMEGLSEEISAQVTTHLTAGAAPLLTHLLVDPVFVKNYLQYGDSLQLISVGAKFGYCNLTNMILKKFIHLSSTDDEAKELWIKPTMPLLETTFRILDTCADVFFTYEDDVYQTLLTHTTAFIIATTSVTMFSNLESLLIKQLLQPSLWPALFTSDLLCLIARVGSSKLCLQLAVLLSDLCSCWPAWDRFRPEWCYVSWTLSRLTQFLAADDRTALWSRLPDLTAVASDMNSLLNKPFSEGSVKIYNSTLKKMTILRDLLDLYPDTKAALIQPLCQMWRRMTLPADVECSETSDWFSTLFAVLVPILSHLVDCLDNTQILNIIDVLENVSSSSTIFKCGACTFLRTLANKRLPSDSKLSIVCNNISLLFVKLLLDGNPLIKQFALETFSYFAYVTKHEEIVAITVAKDIKLQNIITQYLEGVPIVKSEIDFLNYLDNLKAPFVHKCRVSKSKLFEQENLELNPCKKFKNSSNNESVTTPLEKIEKQKKQFDGLDEPSGETQTLKLNGCLDNQSVFGALQKIEKDLNAIEGFNKCSEETQRLVLSCISKRLDEIVRM